ncbi:hypothetical protein M422DRAFT_248865 [Sphaerobolus stellatus SS14]|nr:hypothetical protein M422DRAFT_248849 [Sphaerobolus stellatus SS14]KIJ47454.1 hypothetical protein M422DRAFT_248865 [Sphaerobolus stellatus SS14]
METTEVSLRAGGMAAATTLPSITSSTAYRTLSSPWVPSWSVYPPADLLLLPIKLHPELSHFLIDSQAPISPAEHHLLSVGGYYTPAAKFIIDRLSVEDASSWFQIAHSHEEHQIFDKLSLSPREG